MVKFRENKQETDKSLFLPCGNYSAGHIFIAAAFID